jgi:hypothetical protein
MIINAGVQLLIQFLSGITNNLIKIVEAVGQMITSFITAVETSYSNAQCATDMLNTFLTAIANNTLAIFWTAVSVVVTFINAIGSMIEAIYCRRKYDNSNY